MKKEELFEELISDPILIEKGHFSEIEKETFSIETTSTNKIVEVIKICIDELEKDTDPVEVSRSLNKYLNK
jgi:hypothetical protein